MSTSRLTRALAVISRKMKWPEKHSVCYEGPDKPDKYFNPMLTSPPTSPRSPDDLKFPERLGHWKSFRFDYTSQVADKYYFHESMFITITVTMLLCLLGYARSPDLKAEQKPRERLKLDQTAESELKYSSLLPLRAISSFCGKLSTLNIPSWLRPTVYGFYCDWYGCNMNEAMTSDYKNYRNMGEFFSRRLKPEVRPISREPGIVSPADGEVLHIGPLRNGILEDVKKIDYSVQTFLGLQSDKIEDELGIDKENNQLYDCIIYLGPGDCHRFQSPSKWSIDLRKHFPGRLYSVKPTKLKRRPDILHSNERVCYLGSWSHGFFSMTAVGATNVGSIKVNFDEDLRTNRRHLHRPDCYEHKFDRAIEMKAGQDFGEFNFGSTIVLIFEAPKGSTFSVKANQKIKYGQLVCKSVRAVDSRQDRTS